MENNNSSNSDNKKPRNRRPRRGKPSNRRRPNQSNKEKGPQQRSKSSSNSPESKSNNRGSNSNRNQNRNNNQRRGQQRKGRNYSQRMKRLRKRPLSPEDRFLRSYENLFNAHEKAKYEYFAMFNRVDWRRRRKLELKFYQTIEALRDFESKLEPWQADLVFNKKWKNYRLDTTYSKNHNLDGPEDPPDESEITDPMILHSQINREDYSSDEEESEGTLEDYERYKATKSSNVF